MIHLVAAAVSTTDVVSLLVGLSGLGGAVTVFIKNSIQGARVEDLATSLASVSTFNAELRADNTALRIKVAELEGKIAVLTDEVAKNIVQAVVLRLNGGEQYTAAITPAHRGEHS